MCQHHLQSDRVLQVSLCGIPEEEKTSSDRRSCQSYFDKAGASLDLIDMQPLQSDKHKWIMVYQDYLTKFYVLRALTSKIAT